MAIGELESGPAHVALNGIQCSFTQRDEAFLVAFAHHPHDTHVTVQIGKPQVNEFRDAQPGGVKHFQHGQVAQAAGGVLIGGFKQGLYIRFA